MKRLWKYVPPCYSDVQGFQAVMEQTNGIGIIDDAAGYKAVKPAFQKRDKKEKGKEKKKHHHNDKNALKKKSAARIICSNITNNEIIYGTSEIVQKNFLEAKEEYHPDFALLSNAPSSSMIGSDLAFEAQQITNTYDDFPCAAVDIHGDKDFLYGISVTLLKMGELLLSSQETKPKCVNLLGCNPLEWEQNTLDEAKAFLEENGYHVNSCWGMKETTERLQHGAQASYNLVVNVSGLRLAKYMEEQFHIPYIARALYGKEQCQFLLDELASGTSHPIEEEEDTCDILIIAEQLLGNALRHILKQTYQKSSRVVSFYEMDKELMGKNDARLTCEDDLYNILQNEHYQYVIGDIHYQIMAKPDTKWIAIPAPALQSTAVITPYESFINDRLDAWLDNAFKMEGKENLE